MKNNYVLNQLRFYKNHDSIRSKYHHVTLVIALRRNGLPIPKIQGDLSVTCLLNQVVLNHFSLYFLNQLHKMIVGISKEVINKSGSNNLLMEDYEEE